MLLRRLALPVPALVLAVAVLMAVVAPLARASSSEDAQFVSATNSARAQHGLRAYTVSSDLTSIARRWAAHMAATHTLAHNPGLTSQVCCWTSVGENVGVGSTVSQIQRAFMGSSEHRANILSTRFTQVGIGTARSSDGKLYVDEVFRRPTSAGSASAPAPTVTHPQTYVAPARASRSAPRSALRSARAPHAAVRRPVAAPPLTAALLSRLRASAEHTRRDPVAGAFGYLQVMVDINRRRR